MDLFEASFREMINDPRSRDFKFVFEGGIEVAQEREMESQVKRQLQLAEKEVKEKARIEMIAAKKKAKEIKMKLPCQLSHGGFPCGRTVGECIEFRKRVTAERSASFASLNLRKNIIFSVVNSRNKIPDAPKSNLRKIFRMSIDIKTLLSKNVDDTGNAKDVKPIWSLCSKNLMNHTGNKTGNIMREPKSGDMYQTINNSETYEDLDVLRNLKRKGGPPVHLEVGRDNSVKFLSGKFARIDQSNNNCNVLSKSDRRSSRHNDRTRNRIVDCDYRQGSSGIFGKNQKQTLGLSAVGTFGNTPIFSSIHDESSQISQKTASSSITTSRIKSPNGGVINNGSGATDSSSHSQTQISKRGNHGDEPTYISCADDEEAAEYIEYLGKVFLDSTKYETGSKTILNEFNTGTVVDICKMECVDNDEEEHLYFKFYNQEKHSLDNQQSDDNTDGIYGYCGCVEMAGYSRTGKRKRACYTWPFKI